MKERLLDQEEIKLLENTFYLTSTSLGNNMVYKKNKLC